MAVEHARLGLLGQSYSSTRLPATWSPKDYPYKGDPGTTTVSLRKIDANTAGETDKRNDKVITVIRLKDNNHRYENTLAVPFFRPFLFPRRGQGGSARASNRRTPNSPILAGFFENRASRSLYPRAVGSLGIGVESNSSHTIPRRSRSWKRPKCRRLPAGK